MLSPLLKKLSCRYSVFIYIYFFIKQTPTSPALPSDIEKHEELSFRLKKKYFEKEIKEHSEEKPSGTYYTTIHNNISYYSVCIAS